MSLVTLIRDYVDVANSSEQLDGYTFSSLVYYTLGFFFSILKQVIVNFCTFQWIRDLSYFCLTPPTLFSSFANINISEGTPVQSLSNLVAFSETNFLYPVASLGVQLRYGIGLILLGFFNGCFTSIHISAANLITIQRLLVQGIPAGLCSALGTAIGQCFFLACVHFGFRGLLLPWLSIEPLPFLLGMGILLAIASSSAQDKRTPTIQWSAKSVLLTYTFTSVALAWCEQTALFQLMGNLSFGAEPTLLETTPSLESIETIFGNVQQVIKNGSYILAFFLGNFLGTFFLACALQRLLEFLLTFKGIPIYYGLIKEANLPLATLIFAFGFGSLPYYGFDYLITKGFGFTSQEQFFQQTLFSPANLVSKTSQTKEPTQGRLEDQLALLFTLEGEKNKSFVVDTTPFDDGQYLKAGQKRPQAFEDLNYRGEHLWTNRLSRISNIREQANQTQSSFLGPVFSWMRSFLWGEGPTTRNANKNAQHVEEYTSKAEGIRLSTEGHDKGASVAERGSSAARVRSVLPEEGEDFGGENRQKILANSLDFTKNTKRKKELSAEREQLDNYVKEFDRQFDKGFSNFHNAEPISLIEVEDQWQEQRIKKKCYTNPIYTFLLNREIDSFLGRQPNYHQLSAEEEILLLKRRQLLSNYYDTLAITSQIPTSQAFNQLVPKSFTNAIYNHQFKGTLKTARRLFSIKNALPTLAEFSYANPEERKGYGEGALLYPIPRRGKGGSEIQNDLSIDSVDRSSSRIVKFDQPLFYKEKIADPILTQRLRGKGGGGLEVTEQKKIIFHEELNEMYKQTPSYASPQGGKGYGVLPSLDEDLSYPEGVKESIDKNVFLLEQAESLPLYASWDEDSRKLILINRFQSRIKAGYTYSAPKTVQYEDSGSARSPHSHVFFTAWPLPNPLLLRSQTPPDAPLSERFANKTLHSGNKNVAQLNPSGVRKAFSLSSRASDIFKFVQTTFHLPNFANPKNQFLFPTQSLKEPAPNDMINALLQWQKLIKDNKQLSKEDKQAAKEKVAYWPKNVRRANWSIELMDNDIEFDEPAENTLKKQIILWEFIPPNYGGFIWPGIK